MSLGARAPDRAQTEALAGRARTPDGCASAKRPRLADPWLSGPSGAGCRPPRGGAARGPVLPRGRSAEERCLHRDASRRLSPPSFDVAHSLAQHRRTRDSPLTASLLLRFPGPARCRRAPSGSSHHGRCTDPDAPLVIGARRAVRRVQVDEVHSDHPTHPALRVDLRALATRHKRDTPIDFL